jgi:hypothetical protein
VNLPIWILCPLIIMNDKTEVVQGNSNWGPGYRVGGAGILYEAHTTHFLNAAGSGRPIVDNWVPLDYWGYNLSPGTYTITATPSITVWTKGPGRHFNFSVQSNSLKIRVQQ